jgi:hypothetical protein
MSDCPIGDRDTREDISRMSLAKREVKNDGHRATDVGPYR